MSDDSYYIKPRRVRTRLGAILELKLAIEDYVRSRLTKACSGGDNTAGKVQRAAWCDRLARA